jgi:hypothetical protein
MDGVPDPPAPHPNRAWIAREVNKYIRELAERLRDERPIGFFCECGCMGTALSTVLEYDAASGAWIEGHKPQ